MPNIATYNSNPSLPDRAQWTPASTGAIGGEVMQQEGQQLQQAGDALDKYQTRMQTSKMTADFASAQADLANKQRDTLSQADPNDPNVASNFIDKVVKPTLDSIKPADATPDAQDFYSRTRAALESHFNESTNAGQHELAGIAQSNNAQTAVNQLSNAVTIDPGSFDFSMQHLNEVGNQLVKNGLDRSDWLKELPRFKQTLAISAARGAIDLHPESGAQILDSGRFDQYITGEQKTELLGYARAQQTAAFEAAKRQRTENNYAGISEALAKAVKPDGSLSVMPDVLKSIADDPRIDGKTKFDMITSLTEKMSEVNSKSDPATYSNFRSRLFLGPDDPNKLTAADLQGAFASGHLGASDLNWFNQQLAGNDPVAKEDQRKLNDALQANASAIGKGNMLVSKPLGDQRFLLYQQDAQKLFDQGRAAGIPASELIDARSKNFVGRDWQRYAVSNEDARNQMLGRPTSMPGAPTAIAKPLGQQATAPTANQTALAAANASVLTASSTPAEVKSVIPIVADKYGVPRHIALALVEQESRFKPTAGSPTGATGLTQLTQPIEIKYGLQNNDPDPNKNLDAGLHYLADLKKQWGSWELALKHYGDANQTSYSAEVLARSVKYQTGVAHIESDAEFAALPSGAKFVGPDGKQRTKP